MSRLTVADLWKGYNAQPVLRGVELEVAAGSLTAVLGLSGCGKTTLLRVIAGFERAERGRVRLGERTLDDGHVFLAPERRGIGYVPQEGALFPHLSVEGNVGFGLSRRERRGGAVVGLLELVGLQALAGRFPHQLSGGEQQRVALARALARRPEVLLLDEPFSSLDASLRVRVREEVGELLRAQGVTTVLVTHDQEEALSLADAVAVLRDGEIVQQGAPEELYTRPRDRRLAGFLGAANLVEATFEDGVARTRLGALELRGDPPRAREGGDLVLVRPEQLEVCSRGEEAATQGGPRVSGVERTSANAEHTHAGDVPTSAVEARPGIAGTVEQCRYYGHDALLSIRLEEPGGAESLLARVHGEQALPVGTPVTVAAHGPVTLVEA